MMHASWKVLFPYEIRVGQAELMDFVTRCLSEGQNVGVEAPNGFGKTIAILSSSLSMPCNKVIICTRTHEQVNHIIEEVKMINTKGHNIRCLALGAKWRFCINPWCNGKEIQCQEFLEKDGNDYYCVYEDMYRDDGIRDLLIPKVVPNFFPDVLDIRDVRDLCHEHGFCPYHMMKRFVETADVVVTPYNFVFSIAQRNSIGLDASNSIVVVDESHNLPSVCRSLNTAGIDVDSIRETISSVKSFIGSKGIYALTKIRNWLRRFPKNASSEFKASFGRGFAYGNELLREMYKRGIRRDDILDLINAFERSFDEMPSFPDLYSFLVILFRSNPQTGIGYFNGGKLCYTILDIKKGIQEILDKNSLFVFMSGTLSPIEIFQREIGIELQYRAFETELPNDRFQVEVISQVNEGDDMVKLSTKYNARYNEDVIHSYGKIISELIKTIPNGSIVMFPSYDLMKTMIQNWKIMELIEGEKEIKFKDGIKIYREGNGDFNAMLDNYKRDASQEQTALFSVFRGKITEGTDLPHELCRGIFVVGIPFSNWNSPIVKGIIDYYDKTRTKGSGDAWYIYDALTVVNQGIGRGIRDPSTDYCKAFLLDGRYVYRKAFVYNKLSDWIRTNVVNQYGSKMEDVIKRTESFFKQKEK